MFDDSLVESAGSIRTRSKRYAIASFTLEAIALAIFVLIPYLYPAALPPHALASLLVTPPPPPAPPPPAPPPPAPPPAPHVSSVTAHAPSHAIQLDLAAPRIIPTRIAQASNAPAPPQMTSSFGNARGSEIMSELAAPPPLPRVVPRAKPSGPVRVSSGIAAGHLLAPIRPIYPAIAQAARIQGRVVIEAIISKQGFVEQAHIVSGQPMLAQAALSAVSRARYQPYKLNGDPVEVETTINIDFVLGN